MTFTTGNHSKLSGSAVVALPSMISLLSMGGCGALGCALGGLVVKKRAAMIRAQIETSFIVEITIQRYHARMAEIVELTRFDATALKEINALLKQLSERIPACTPELLKKILKNEHVEMWVVREGGRIVGMAELVLILKPEGVIAQIEDVVVDETMRGKGLGQQLSEKLIQRAKARGARAVHLSSHVSRVAGNKLYQKLGFEKWDTNFYRMKL